MLDWLAEHPCVDCGEDDIVVLEFDHLRDKEFNITTKVVKGYTWESILKTEIPKCEVVCCNCHRRRTNKRANTRRRNYSIGSGGTGRPT